MWLFLSNDIFLNGFYLGFRMKCFLFLYPTVEIINHQIKEQGYGFEGGVDAFREKYIPALNQCIDLRYRQKGFQVFYPIPDDSDISEFISVEPSDKIMLIKGGFWGHRGKGSWESDFILDHLKEVSKLRVGGFYLWDCVQAVAKDAYSRGLDVLVDEDLTDFFAWRFLDLDFSIDSYPSINPRKWNDKRFEEFMEARGSKPWMWQDY